MQDLEEEKHQSGAHFCKAMQDMECMNVEMISLVDKAEMAENHALGETQNLASEIQMK